MWIPALIAPLRTLSVALQEGYGGTEGPDLTRYAVVCGVLVLALGGLAFGFRRMVAGAVRGRAAQRSLSIVDVLPLGGKQKLCVIRCYDRTFALGVGDKEVNLVAELDAVIGGSEEQGGPDHVAAASTGASTRTKTPTKADAEAFLRALQAVRRKKAAKARTRLRPEGVLG